MLTSDQIERAIRLAMAYKNCPSSLLRKAMKETSQKIAKNKDHCDSEMHKEALRIMDGLNK